MKEQSPTALVEVLMTSGCGHGRETVELVRAVLVAAGHGDVPVETVVVQDRADAVRRQFRGSPTVRVDGDDIDPAAPADVGMG